MEARSRRAGSSRGRHAVNPVHPVGAGPREHDGHGSTQTRTTGRKDPATRDVAARRGSAVLEARHRRTYPAYVFEANHLRTEWFGSGERFGSGMTARNVQSDGTRPARRPQVVPDETAGAERTPGASMTPRRCRLRGTLGDSSGLRRRGRPTSRPDTGQPRRQATRATGRRRDDLLPITGGSPPPSPAGLRPASPLSPGLAPGEPTGAAVWGTPPATDVRLRRSVSRC